MLRDNDDGLNDDRKPFVDEMAEDVNVNLFGGTYWPNEDDKDVDDDDDGEDDEVEDGDDDEVDDDEVDDGDVDDGDDDVDDDDDGEEDEPLVLEDGEDDVEYTFVNKVNMGFCLVFFGFECLLDFGHKIPSKHFRGLFADDGLYLYGGFILLDDVVFVGLTLFGCGLL